MPTCSWYCSSMKSFLGSCRVVERHWLQAWNVSRPRQKSVQGSWPAALCLKGEQSSHLMILFYLWHILVQRHPQNLYAAQSCHCPLPPIPPLPSAFSPSLVPRCGASPPSTSTLENLQADDLFQSRSRRKTTLSKWVEISHSAGGWWCKRWQFWDSEGRSWLSIFFTKMTLTIPKCNIVKAKICIPQKIFCHLIPPFPISRTGRLLLCHPSSNPRDRPSLEQIVAAIKESTKE